MFHQHTQNHFSSPMDDPYFLPVLPGLAESLPPFLLFVCSPDSLVVLACLLGEMRLVRFLEKLIDPLFYPSLLLPMLLLGRCRLGEEARRERTREEPIFCRGQIGLQPSVRRIMGKSFEGDRTLCVVIPLA